MRTLKQLAQLIQSNYSGGDATIDSKPHVRDIIIHIRHAANELLKLEYYNNRKDGDRSVPTMYIATYSGVAMQSDKTERIMYVDLPQGYIVLPYNKGVHKVHIENEPQHAVTKSRNKYITDNLPSGENLGMTSCWIEGLKIKFRNHSLVKVGNLVTLKLVIAAPDSITENAILPLYPEQEGMIVELVMKRISPSYSVIHDARNDGNQDIGVKVNG